MTYLCRILKNKNMKTHYFTAGREFKDIETAKRHAKKVSEELGVGIEIRKGGPYGPVIETIETSSKTLNNKKMKEYKILVNNHVVLATDDMGEALEKMQQYGASASDTVRIIDEGGCICAIKRIHEGFKNYSLYLDDEKVACGLTYLQADYAAERLMMCDKHAKVRVVNLVTGYEMTHRERRQ